MFIAYFKSFFIGCVLTTHCIGFQPTHRFQHQLLHSSLDANSDSQYPVHESRNDKKSFIDSFSKASTAVLAAYSLMGGLTSTAAYAGTAVVVPDTPSRGFQTKSGLKYFDFQEGLIGKTPRYGQLVSFQYTGYYRAGPDSPLEVFDSVFSSEKKNSISFLHKHGNGRIVRGIDEGLHTMKVGGKRRIVVPRAIGYTDFGTGPVPTEPSDRRRLSKFLERLDVDKGELVFDLELVMVADDENDQGYYEDEPVTQEEVRQLVLKSMSTEDNAERMDKMMQTTPKNKLFKKIIDVVEG